VIVASEEVMALYAANNIAKAVCHSAANGVMLAGIVINMRDNDEDRAPAERFAKLIGSQIIGWVPRDPLIREAEYCRQTVLEYAPHSDIAKVFRTLAEKILAVDPQSVPLPTPLSETQFYEYARSKFDVPARAEGVPAPAQATAATSEPAEGVITAARLLGPKVLEAREAKQKAAAARRAEFEQELRAGMRAVRLGRVRVDEALRRLRAHFPTEAARPPRAEPPSRLPTHFLRTSSELVRGNRHSPARPSLQLARARCAGTLRTGAAGRARCRRGVSRRAAGVLPTSDGRGSRAGRASAGRST
jgi:hypothetical protein